MVLQKGKGGGGGGGAHAQSARHASMAALINANVFYVLFFTTILK